MMLPHAGIFLHMSKARSLGHIRTDFCAILFLEWRIRFWRSFFSSTQFGHYPGKIYRLWENSGSSKNFQFLYLHSSVLRFAYLLRAATNCLVATYVKSMVSPNLFCITRWHVAYIRPRKASLSSHTQRTLSLTTELWKSWKFLSSVNRSHITVIDKTVVTLR